MIRCRAASWCQPAAIESAVSRAEAAARARSATSRETSGMRAQLRWAFSSRAAKRLATPALAWKCDSVFACTLRGLAVIARYLYR